MTPQSASKRNFHTGYTGKKFAYKGYHSSNKKKYMNTCYVFLINGHLIYCDTKGSTWHSICSNSLPTPTT